MSLFFGVPVDLAYHLVCWIAAILAPLTGGLATAAAIIAFTVLVRLLLLPLSYFAVRGSVRGEGARARLQPRIAELQRRHNNDPQRLQRELGALYRAEGAGMFGGFLPLLIQLPFFSVMYRLFLDHSVGGVPNTLLTHTLLAAPLGSHWLAGAGPLSAQGAVFAGLFALLAAVAVLAVRAARRAAPAVPPVPVTPARGKVPAGSATAASATSASATSASATRASATRASATRASVTRASVTRASVTRASVTPVSATPVSATPASVPGGRAVSFVTWVIPFASLVTAAIVPLAAGLYLLTTTAWTLAERTVLRRRFISATGPQSAGAAPQ
jgi:YidC/Oxa1 family membrane protein insertase